MTVHYTDAVVIPL